MAKTSKKPQAEFIIRLVAQGLRPWLVPMRSLTRVLNAVQRLIEHTEADEAGELREDEEAQPLAPLHLIGVVSGSAVYSVSALDEGAAVKTLAETARGLRNPDKAEWTSEMLSSIEDLSAVAKALHCNIEFNRPGSSGESLATITPLSYEEVSRTAFVKGESSICGYLERVGGAIKRHCGLRLPSQPSKMLICPVDTEDLIRQLGQHVYQNVRVSGTVTWLRRTWRVKSVFVKAFEPSKSGSIMDALNRIYEAGGKDWDDVDDADALIAEMRKP
jgi:hypothetical protein